ncbi:amidohydrolase [Microbacterium sp. VKM Ac-2923]|uniref:amidohydrolase n=1 Tax=Microbacterium sp. VKM Ac-2923 TaxID=2929476 RepID=UPI001FB35617|nr:amidohydrolase [Microbacterium sp. VKM Ac-2923]MCJ1706772.1 amidohydrolase [Microbacterium sp. VKM Ac-2923]
MSSLLVTDGILFSAGTVLDADSVGVRDGRIVAVGSRREVRDALGTDADELDARGGLVTPGFVDAHLHLGGGAVDALRCDLSGAATLAEVDERIRSFAAGATAAWIVGGGWDPTLFPPSGPTAAHLDSLVGDRPAFLLDADHHGAWANSAALAAASIDRDTPDPSDGRLERAPDGSPTGALREGAMQLVSPLIPPNDTDDIARALLEVSRSALAAGITGWQEAALGVYAGYPDFSHAYLALLRDGALVGRATGAIWVPRDLTAAGIDAFVAETVDRARVNSAAGFPTRTAKLMLDGIVETRTAHLCHPYPDGSHGLSYFAPDLVQQLVPALNAAGIAVHVHALGDAAVHDALDGFAAVPSADRSRVRNHIAHLELIAPDDVARFAALEVTANCQPYWACANALVRQVTLPLLGRERADDLYPFAALREAGARLAMGSDWPVSTFDPWLGVHVAVTRRPPGEADAEPLGAAQSLPLETALDAYTRGSADLLGIGPGVLEPGAAADLAIADRNPFAGAAAGIHETRNRATVVAGEVVAV